MISWLKRIFIPHEGNNHRPQILDKKNIRSILILVLLIEFSVFLLPTLVRLNNTGGMAAVLPAVLSNLANEIRQDQNLGVLKVNEDLNNAAKMKAEDMATKGYFAHTGPDGKTPWYWIEKVGYKYQYAGENLAINFSDSKDVTNAWMNSPTHKANIIKRNYTEVGTGIAVGTYEGRETLFVAQVYANPVLIDSRNLISEKINKKNIKINKEENINVLGAETVAMDSVEVKDIEPVNIINKDTVEQKPNLIQELFTSPRNNTNKALLLVFGIILISLFLNIFIKIKHHHPDLITNGLITLMIIGAIFVVNNYISGSNMVALDSFDYSIADIK